MFFSGAGFLSQTSNACPLLQACMCWWPSSPPDSISQVRAVRLRCPCRILTGFLSLMFCLAGLHSFYPSLSREHGSSRRGKLYSQESNLGWMEPLEVVWSVHSRSHVGDFGKGQTSFQCLQDRIPTAFLGSLFWHLIKTCTTTSNLFILFFFNCILTDQFWEV